MKRHYLILTAFLLASAGARAEQKFIVRDIRVDGLQRISAGTVFNYLPIKVGDTVTEKSTQDAIRALFKTGFFKDIRLAREGDLLVVNVVERPSIAGVRILGTKEFSETDLLKGLKETGLTEGRVFNSSLLDRVEQELRNQYFSRGYYSVIIRPTVTPLERNRMDITIDVSEGETARIREIHIVGSEVFPESELLDLFALGPRSWWAIFSSRDQYSKPQLSGDIEKLRNHYQDQGYLDFSIDSTQVSITPDRRQIYITIALTEGRKYTVTGAKLAGRFVVPESELNALVTLKPGETFSRRKITEITKAITDRLAAEGYAFANVNPVPDVNKEKGEVAFTFFIDPGNRVYVRRINFSGNVATREEVLRRELRQYESAWYSSPKIQRSRIRLQRLGFFDDVNIETPAVPGTPDQVDVNVTVKERPTGNLLLGVGYSDSDGFLINASVTQSNLFGSGKELAVSYNNTQSTTNYNLRYSDPYHTPDGIARGFNIFSTTTDAGQAGTAAYNTQSHGIGVFYSIPLTEDNRIHLGADIERNKLDATSTSAQVAQDFVAANGPTNTSLKATVSWSKDTLDSALVPSSGTLHRVTGEISIPGSDIQYYKLTYLTARYWPVGERSAFKLKGELGYGDGFGDTKELPFFKNYYAGGSSTVRGFESRSLGPRDTLYTSDPIGGSKRMLGNMEYLFPMPGSPKDEKAMRLALFVDAGMAYGPQQEIDLGELRYSAGLAFNWFSPVGPLSFSYAVPLNEKSGDKVENFQFTLGVPLR
jgi:outer membrane protein insertion porin family